MILLAHLASAQARDATLLVQNDPEKRGDPGIWLCDLATQKVKRIHTAMVGWAVFSPNGKRIAYTDGDGLFVMNNDNTDKTLLCTDGGWNEYNRICWTTEGVFWSGNGYIQRYAVDRGVRDSLVALSELGDYCQKGGGFYSSRDGRAMWIGRAYGDCDNSPRRLYLSWDTDFSSSVKAWDVRHGISAMSAAGYVFESLSRYSTHLAITRQEGSTVTIEDSSFTFPSPIDEYRSNWLVCSINNDSLLALFAWRDEQREENGIFLVNWRSNESLGTFPWPCDDCSRTVYGGLWGGPLPDPHEGRPFIELTSKRVKFDLAVAPDTLSRTVRIVNRTSRPLAKLEASSSDSWIAPTVVGEGGDTQTVRLDIRLAEIASRKQTAMVSVSGGNAYNSVVCTVTVTRRNYLMFPTDLRASVTGSHPPGVRLTWTDNSQNETGFMIERCDTANVFRAIGSVAADSTTFIDQNIDTSRARFYYRVIAFTDTNDRKYFSPYSNEVSLGSIPAAQHHRAATRATIPAIHAYTRDRRTYVTAPPNTGVAACLYDPRGKLLAKQFVPKATTGVISHSPQSAGFRILRVYDSAGACLAVIVAGIPR
jgi:hypothetical protein